MKLSFKERYFERNPLFQMLPRNMSLHFGVLRAC